MDDGIGISAEDQVEGFEVWVIRYGWQHHGPDLIPQQLCVQRRISPHNIKEIMTEDDAVFLASVLRLFNNNSWDITRHKSSGDYELTTNES